MSNPKTAIHEIKKLMVQFGLISAENVNEKFAEAKLVDGTVVKVEGDLVEGAAVKVVTEDAEVPAPDGVHELEGGMKVETKDGVIVKIEEVEPKEMGDAKEKMKDVPVMSEVPEEVADIAKPVVDAIVEAIVPVLEEVKELAQEMKKMKEKMESYKNDFEAFKKEPAGKKIKSGKTDFSAEEKDNSDEARIATIMSFKKLKK